ncbi:Topoisomerase 1-associated factor 1 [Collariella sp. IMI 366227]|nr:Topoisomerase 1-associated factor 1 [Collariella sp. IMI 366227]
MEDAEGANDTVHPQVRAHINSLVSALGGYSIDDDDGYKLGDDALEVLRDIKKWIRFYDEKTNRMDVARCLADANLVGSDLLQILATWPPNENSKYKAKIALACLEVMVPLTWPIERDRETMTVNHYRHLPTLQLAQLGYKRAIINFDAAQILQTAVRLALPSMAISIGDRSARDQGIIKLVLYFLRNIAMISPPPGVKFDGDETQISRSTLIDAFTFQDITYTLLMFASNMGEDFRTEDVIVMETIFHLVKRVESKKLFVNEKQLHKMKANELTAAMNKEAAMLRSYNKNAPTRHSRFGSMIWVKRESGKLATVSGQDALLDAATRERKMDSTKTFKPPRRARKEEMEPKDLGPPVSLDERARQQLQNFVSEFLDSGFNPLFSHVRKSLDREGPHVLHYHQGQFFYLVAWFLRAERMRRQAKKDSKQVSSADGVGSFNLVAEVLNQEMFITLNRAMDRAYGDKDWRLLTTVMRCFTQILLTVQEMTASGNEENEEIADNILSRLFYEETTHDAIANIVRTYKDQGFEYLDASTELCHTFLRILEGIFEAECRPAGPLSQEDNGQADLEDDSADDERQVEKTSQERKFDFKRFAIRFIPQGVVDTFVTFTKYYRDLDDEQLKRAHRYFHRVAFKQDMSVMLFRLDIIHLFYNVIKGPEPLDKNSSVYKEWEDLAKHVIKKTAGAFHGAALLPKINSTAHYLEYGYEKQTISSNPRPGAELEFKREVEHDQQIAIVVGVMIDRNQTDHLEWIKTQLSEAERERRAWEDADKALAAENPNSGEASAEPNTDKTPPHTTVRPDSDARRTAMFKNPHLRLLMQLAGMERLTSTLDESPDSTWIIPGSLPASTLKETIIHINKAERPTPPQIRGRGSQKKRVAYDDDDDVGDLINDGSDDEGIFFPAGGPTTRKRTAEDGQPAPKKRRQRRKQAAGSQEPEDDGMFDEQARARREKQLEKARRVKSEMYVDPADDDDNVVSGDVEFFAREAARQEAKNASFGLSSKVGAGAGAETSLWEALLEEDDEVAPTVKEKGKRGASRKRKSDVVELDESSEDEEEEGGSASGSDASSGRTTAKRRKPAQKKRTIEISSDEEDGDEMDVDEDATQSSKATDGAATNDTPLSSNPGQAAKPPAGAEEDNEDDDLPVAKAVARARPRARAGFIIDSSDEE